MPNRIQRRLSQAMWFLLANIADGSIALRGRLRRWVAVVTAPATSPTVLAQKFWFWVGFPLALATIPAFAAGWLWTAPVRSWPVWMYLLLVVTRQRDEARRQATVAETATVAPGQAAPPKGDSRG